MILRELAAKYDLKFNDRSFKKADTAINGAISQIKKLGITLGAVAAARFAFKFVDDVRALGDTIDKTTASLGISRQAFQEWEFVVGLGGVKTQELNVSLRTLQKSMAESADGVATYKDEFDRMGISVTDSTGTLKSADQVLMEMADGLQTLDSETQKVATAQILLGRSGSKMLPVFAKGSKGVAKFKEEAHELGGVLSDELIDSAVNLTDDVWRFDFAMRGIKSTIGVILLPIVSKLVTGWSRLAVGFKKATEGTNSVKHGLQLLGIVAAGVAAKLAISFAAPLLVFAKWIILIAAVYLVYDDLMTLFEGGDSIIGRLIDSIFGKGSAAWAIDRLKEAGEGMVLFWKNEWLPGLQEAGEDLHWFKDQVVDTFTTMTEKVTEFFNNFADMIKNSPPFGGNFNKPVDSAIEDTGELGDKTNAATGTTDGSTGIVGKVAKIILGPLGTMVMEKYGLDEARDPGHVAIANRRMERAMQPAPGIIQPGSTSTTNNAPVYVNPQTTLNMTIQTPPGADAKVVSQLAETAVMKVVDKQNRATMQAVKQRIR